MLEQKSEAFQDIFCPILPQGKDLFCGNLHGAAKGMLLANLAHKYDGIIVVFTQDTPEAYQLENELRFFLGKERQNSILNFPDWETLPYDIFSPFQDIVSQRLLTLYRLPKLTRGILLVPVATAMQRIAPQAYIDQHTFDMRVGDRADLDAMRKRLENGGYRYVSQVLEHGDFSVRGSLLDLFPMGSDVPYRIDLLDDEVESIRVFDPENQRTVGKVDVIQLLPAHEFPSDQEAIARFRQRYREVVEGDPQRSEIYREVSQGRFPPGIEYYLPLFFENTATLFDFLPTKTLLVATDGSIDSADIFWRDIEHRYDQLRHNIERPLLTPELLFVAPAALKEILARTPIMHLQNYNQIDRPDACTLNFETAIVPALEFSARDEVATNGLEKFAKAYTGRILITAESEGRRELIREMLSHAGMAPVIVNHWSEFLRGNYPLGLAIAPLETGVMLTHPALTVIAEPQLFGSRIQQKRRRSRSQRDAEAIVRELTDLVIGSPVVHEDYGVGRYLGLQKLPVNGEDMEFLALQYAGSDKLYVPVSSLHLISRYMGANADTVPLHKLGTDQWQRAKRKATEKARDVAAELLDIYARREAAKGLRFTSNEREYLGFAASFPYEETPDQQSAIEATLQDLASGRPMDRVVCGDVGFGKTEVAMRAAFVVANGGKQVAVLVPTTLLAQQHYQNFVDRFAQWPFRIEVLSRFRSKAEQTTVLKALEQGKADILIATHKLIQDDIKFKDLGLLIVDEEHRFGVRQKEKLKALRTHVAILTLTATPIPRTMNMSLAGLRDLSIIATPPAHRHAVKTFVCQWDNAVIQEAVQRELKRGGQVYFLHNEVETIEKTARELSALIPEANVRFAHGQMRERELESTMGDFYHRRFNVLLATTIIESGIDIPNANTIIINRADKLGLAQLHQLRGRVGRSHHRAYAYLLVPPKGAMTPDAIKRLEAISSLETLGAGFMLATHDLEIRGAGELLGEEQSGQIQEVGFTLYTELLQRAVQALKSGKEVDFDQPLHHGAEIDLGIPALIPDTYLPDVHARLIMYKRIANANGAEALKDLQVEMIDRFGLLPEQTKTLFVVTGFRHRATPLGIRKIEIGPQGGRVIFDEKPNVDAAKIVKLIQTKSKQYRLEGASRLRILQTMPNAQSRIAVLEELLQQLN
ncbi:MAG: transcription-repair coupling factor [Pseudomonadota bacterium]